MKDYVYRMVNERYGLSARIGRAEKFIENYSSSLSLLSLSLLKSQVSAMKSYLSILETRISYESSF